MCGFLMFKNYYGSLNRWKRGKGMKRDNNKRI